ncbi:MAG TPA: Uma2 family endonuclease [Gemmataceae bacterium]
MHTPRHAATLVDLGGPLQTWVQHQHIPEGRVYAGASFRLHRGPDTLLYFDIALSSDTAERSTPVGAAFIEGPPLLAAEVLEPWDTHGDIVERAEACLANGVRLVWVIDPAVQTVTVYRPDAEPELFNVRQELTGEPHLPGFRVPARDIFGG